MPIRLPCCEAIGPGVFYQREAEIELWQWSVSTRVSLPPPPSPCAENRALSNDQGTVGRGEILETGKEGGVPEMTVEEEAPGGTVATETGVVAGEDLVPTHEIVLGIGPRGGTETGIGTETETGEELLDSVGGGCRCMWMCYAMATEHRVLPALCFLARSQ